MNAEERVKEIIDTVIDAGDRTEEARLPSGSKVRAKLSTLDCFQAAYVSKTWSQKKHDAMDKATRHLRPPHRVIHHLRGTMTVEAAGGWRFDVTPMFWEPVAGKPKETIP
jgi:hypothetical protein